MSSARDSRSAVAGLASLPCVRSALVSDALDRLGRRAQCLLSDVVALREPVTLIGPAFTVCCVRVDEPSEQPYRGLLAALDAIAAGDVFVFPTARADIAAVWGELLTTACVARGVAGLITDGFVRDLQQIARHQFPLYARGTLPTDIDGRLDIVGMQEEVEVDGVKIRPGDVIVADVDGVVIVPAELEADVTALVDAKSRDEDKFRAAVTRGVAPSVAFERYGVL